MCEILVKGKKVICLRCKGPKEKESCYQCEEKGIKLVKVDGVFKQHEIFPRENHTTVGFYNNGDSKWNIVAWEDLPIHIWYNEIFRPGRMLFLDGKYCCGGMGIEIYKNEKIAEYEQILMGKCFAANVPTIPYR